MSDSLLSTRTRGPSSAYPFDDVYSGEDDYPAIHDEDIAYAVFDWDELDAKIVARHDELLAMSAEEAAEVDLARTPDLHRWALARVWARENALDRYVEVCASILETPGPDRSPWISYADVRIERARRLATLERFDEAFEELHRYQGEDKANVREYARYLGIITLLAGNLEEGTGLLREAIEENEAADPELALYLGDELLTLDLDGPAIAVYDAGIALARRRNMPDLLAELEDAKEAAESRDARETTEASEAPEADAPTEPDEAGDPGDEA